MDPWRKRFILVRHRELRDDDGADTEEGRREEPDWLSLRRSRRTHRRDPLPRGRTPGEWRSEPCCRSRGRTRDSPAGCHVATASARSRPPRQKGERGKGRKKKREDVPPFACRYERTGGNRSEFWFNPELRYRARGGGKESGEKRRLPILIGNAPRVATMLASITLPHPILPDIAHGRGRGRRKKTMI